MVPAVPGYKALFLGGEASVAFATTAYTFAGTLVWEYGTGGVDVSSTIAAGLLTAVASSSATAIPVAVATIAEATVANNAIVFRASANPTVGDSPLTVRTFYTLVPSP
jgi:hypothetical protein